MLLGPAARWQNARGRLHQKRHQLTALKQNSYRIPVLAAIPLLQNGLEEKAWKGVVDHWDIRVNVHPIGREVQKLPLQMPVMKTSCPQPCLIAQDFTTACDDIPVVEMSSLRRVNVAIGIFWSNLTDTCFDDCNANVGWIQLTKNV